jgi:hypothetical protein
MMVDVVDESLRLAYLAAMEIPVWELRTGSTPDEPAAAAVPVARVASASHASRAQFFASVATPAKPTARPVAPLVSAAIREQTSTAFAFAAAGPILFVDEAMARPKQAGAAALLGAVAFALSGVKAEADVQAFDWPPQGVSVDAAQMRDAVMGRLRKLLHERKCQRIVLMGQAPAALLLGWSAETFAARTGSMGKIAGIDCGVCVTRSSAELLADPRLKREAWRDLRCAVMR